MQGYKVRAMIHSQEDKGAQEITIKTKNNNNDYIVITPNGIKCHAIYNIFTNLYYADDIYGVIEEGERNTRT